jgi:hypothetical protein
MSHFTRLTLATLLIGASLGEAARVKPRYIVTTDGEVDDRSTMIRFLMYASDMDIVGIVENNSKYQKSGHSKDKWIQPQIDAYESLLPTLRLHNPDYPSAAYLRGLLTVGNENSADLYVAPPEMATKNTAGEKWIIKTLLDDDPRPVHIGCWGGVNTVASALWRLKSTGEYTAAQYKKAVDKIRIYAIWYQDGGGQWVEDNIKGAYIYEAYKWDNVWDYQSYEGNPKGGSTSNPKEQGAYMTPEWLNANVKKNHGPLGALTPQTYISEGDSPSFFNLINNGLESYVDYTYGGWGGRGAYDDIAKSPNHITDGSLKDDGNSNKMFWRWVIPAQNDFAARMDWCVAKTFSAANHAPVAKLNGTTVADGPFVTISAKPGSTVALDATGSLDPDNNTLSYTWWVYKEVGSYGKPASIADSLKAKATLTIPADALNKTLHVILEVRDNGTPNLIGYRRAIINVTDNPTSIIDARSSQATAVRILHHSGLSGKSVALLPKEIEAQSELQLVDIDGRSLPFELENSGEQRQIAYHARGVAFLRVRSHHGTVVYKLL